MKKIYLSLLFASVFTFNGYARKAVDRTEVFVTRHITDIPYRIPALAVTKNGDVLCVADFRYSRADIGFAGPGNGRIDLRQRRSTNHGKSWKPFTTIVKGWGNEKDDFYTGFGDPCLVADRKSKQVLLLCCAGNVPFPGGTRAKHLSIASVHSNDNGKTWGTPHDLTEEIYALFDNCSRGPVQSMFIGSGKIHQSRYTKVGKYYRLFCSNLVKDKQGEYNYVLYSDDFGHHWHLLGNVEDVPIIQGNEPKVEELPDGRILLSSRAYGGRVFNIFTYDNEKQGTGKWAKQAFSGESNKGTTAVTNSCNGEILLVPVIRKADRARLFLALQSVPLGPGRSHVGIYYKDLSQPESYATPQDFASQWTGKYTCTTLPSAYSTMVLQQDGRIGFAYEEETHCSTHGGGYTIVYERYTIEEITQNVYELDYIRCGL